MFVLIILATTDKRREAPAPAPIAIGLALTLMHFALIGFTGTSVNPARSIGLAFSPAGTSEQWVFILAPLRRRRGGRPRLPRDLRLGP